MLLKHTNYGNATTITKLTSNYMKYIMYSSVKLTFWCCWHSMLRAGCISAN
jgi:hypothetical protein